MLRMSLTSSKMYASRGYKHTDLGRCCEHALLVPKCTPADVAGADLGTVAISTDNCTRRFAAAEPIARPQRMSRDTDQLLSTLSSTNHIDHYNYSTNLFSIGT
jgi:hypothetical protein